MDKQRKLVLVIAIMASFVAFLDGSVVGVALPAITRELGGGLILQQWVNDAYLITLGTLILAAGSLSDIFGRKRIITYGLWGFLAASLLCAVAPNGVFLISARALQGVAGALLVPSSLALIISVISGKAQGKAIGQWTAWTGIAFIVGPLVGGLMVDLLSWRLVFAINVLPIAAALLLLARLRLNEERTARASVDYAGIILGALGLGGVVYGLIEQESYGWHNPIVLIPLILGVVLLGLFGWYEKRALHPMLTLELFKVRNFSVGNVATFFIYAALSLQGFVLVIFLQQVSHFPATLAGLASLPITIIMFFLSSRFGGLSAKFGPRLFMAAGPILAGLGTLWFLQVSVPTNYWLQILPGILLFGLGLSITVAPLTSAILGSIDPAKAGIGSAINNAVARIAGLIAVAAIGSVIGASLDLPGFKRSILVCSALLIIGGIISAIGITNKQAIHHEKSPTV